MGGIFPEIFPENIAPNKLENLFLLFVLILCSQRVSLLTDAKNKIK
jgi:hypothetical protein